LGGRPAEEYWLTQTQSLKVASKSETDVADKIRDRVIAGSQAVNQGEGLKPDRLPGGTPDVDRLCKLEAAVQRLERTQVCEVPAAEPESRQPIWRRLPPWLHSLFRPRQVPGVAGLVRRSLPLQHDLFPSLLLHVHLVPSWTSWAGGT
jgi:hypothetical protein